MCRLPEICNVDPKGDKLPFCTDWIVSSVHDYRPFVRFIPVRLSVLYFVLTIVFVLITITKTAGLGLLIGRYQILT